jgi:hypothetical protein
LAKDHYFVTPSFERSTAPAHGFVRFSRPTSRSYALSQIASTIDNREEVVVASAYQRHLKTEAQNK